MTLRERYRKWRKRSEIWPSSGTHVIGTQMDLNYDPPSASMRPDAKIPPTGMIDA
jgi:hypothetical protein